MFASQAAPSYWSGFRRLVKPGYYESGWGADGGKMNMDIEGDELSAL